MPAQFEPSGAKQRAWTSPQSLSCTQSVLDFNALTAAFACPSQGAPPVPSVCPASPPRPLEPAAASLPLALLPLALLPPQPTATISAPKSALTNTHRVMLILTGP